MRINSKDIIYGQYEVSPDPFITQRAIILGCLAKGKTYIANPCVNEDFHSLVSCAKKLGAKIKIKSGVAEIKPPKTLVGATKIDCGRNETAMRFLCGIAAGNGMYVELTGDKWLCQRSMRNVKEPLETMGATVALKNYTVPPVLVEGETVRPIDYFLPMGTSQVKSSVLLCALSGKVTAKIKEGVKSRNHMEILLKEMGANIDVDFESDTVTLKPSEIKGKKIFICGDFTESAYFLAQGLMGGRVECKNVGVNVTRTRLLKILKRMGARIKIVNRRMLCGEPIADIIAEISSLKATLITDEEAYSVHDELPALAILAGVAQGESVIAEHKAFKDLDENLFDSVAETINGLGGRCRRFNGETSGIVITGVERYKGGVIKGGNSARVSLAAAIALTVSEDGGEIEDETRILAEYPNFFNTLKSNSFAYLSKRDVGEEIAKINSFVLNEMKIKNYSYSLKTARGVALKKVLSEFKELNGFSVCSDYIPDAAKRVMKYRGVAKFSKMPDAVKGLEGLATDGDALLYALATDKFEIEDKSVLVIGCGAVCKNVVAALKDKKAHVDVYETNTKAAAEFKKRFDDVSVLSEINDEKYDVIVNTSAVCFDIFGESEKETGLLKESTVVADFVCTRGKSPFVINAESRGAAIIDGQKLTFFNFYLADCMFAGKEAGETEALSFYEKYVATEKNADD